MAQVCPISTRRIDAHMVRAISLQVVLLAIVLLITKQSIFAYILLYDFSMRALRKPKLSALHFIAKFVLDGWGIAPKLCDESPKRFALYMGLVISLLLVLFYSAGFVLLATVITVILSVCALLETVFDYCIGCKIYYAIQMIKGYI